MFQEERQERILSMLRENQSIRIAHLAMQLGVTRETIRKDLYELEQQGHIKKVHGGALLNKTNAEPSYTKRSQTNPALKEQIAAKAAEYVEDGDSIYIDIGTTTLLLAQKLKQRNKLTVITNSIPVAAELGNHPGAKVIMCGGEVRGEELALSGPLAIQSLQNIYIDKAFIGIGGLSIESGFTDYHIGESEIRKMMLAHAKERYALMDHSKAFITAFYKTASAQELDFVITDQQTHSNIVKYLTDNGVEVIIAG